MDKQDRNDDDVDTYNDANTRADGDGSGSRDNSGKETSSSSSPLSSAPAPSSSPSPSPLVPVPSAIVPAQQMDPFGQFQQAEGASQHAAYEAAKTLLKDLKIRQKDLVSTVNAAKLDIDTHSERLNELNSESIASLKESSAEEIAELKGVLAGAKKAYRARRSELLQVKEELAAGTLKKQELLKELVSAYETFRAAEGS